VDIKTVLHAVGQETLTEEWVWNPVASTRAFDSPPVEVDVATARGSRARHYAKLRPAIREDSNCFRMAPEEVSIGDFKDHLPKAITIR